MPYFEKFPKIEYNGVVMPDVSIRYKINDIIKNNINVYELYRVSENEKVEDVAYKMYGDVNYHWVILMTNDITDPLGGWFRNDIELAELSAMKWSDPSDIHHAMDAEGYAVNYDANDPGATTNVTNAEYDALLNDELREIKILRPRFLAQAINEFESTINA